MTALFEQFRHGDPTNREFQKRLIDTFVNAVYVFDDKLVLTYNYQHGTQTISLEEIESALSSDFDGATPPKTANRKAFGLAVLLYLQVQIHPLPHQYTAFNDDGKLEFPYTLSVPPRGCQLHGRGQSKHDVHIHFRKHSATDSAGSQYNSLLHRLW